MHGYGGREGQRMGRGAGTYGRRHLNSGMNRMRNAGLESRRNPSLMTPPELKVQVAIFMTVARVAARSGDVVLSVAFGSNDRRYRSAMRTGFGLAGHVSRTAGRPLSRTLTLRRKWLQRRWRPRSAFGYRSARLRRERRRRQLCRSSDCSRRRSSSRDRHGGLFRAAQVDINGLRLCIPYFGIRVQAA